MNDYANSAALAYACPPIRVSHPPALDNTPRFSFDEQRLSEPAKIVLCFDCQRGIAAGKGIQVTRNLNGHSQVIHTLVHPDCAHTGNARYELANLCAG